VNESRKIEVKRSDKCERISNRALGKSFSNVKTVRETFDGTMLLVDPHANHADLLHIRLVERFLVARRGKGLNFPDLHCFADAPLVTIAVNDCEQCDAL